MLFRSLWRLSLPAEEITLRSGEVLAHLYDVKGTFSTVHDYGRTLRRAHPRARGIDAFLQALSAMAPGDLLWVRKGSGLALYRLSGWTYDEGHHFYGRHLLDVEEEGPMFRGAFLGPRLRRIRDEELVEESLRLAGGCPEGFEESREERREGLVLRPSASLLRREDVEVIPLKEEELKPQWGDLIIEVHPKKPLEALPARASDVAEKEETSDVITAFRAFSEAQHALLKEQMEWILAMHQASVQWQEEWLRALEESLKTEREDV